MIRIHRLWLFVIAVALSVSVGPPTHTQHPEGAIGSLPAPAVVGMTGETFTVTVRQNDTVDVHGLFFFELDVKPAGRVTVMADRDLAIAKALQALAGQKVRLTLEPIELQHLEREKD